MVPVSCPPCPASMTMRLIFRPRARVNERLPSRVGFDSVGVISAAALLVSLFGLGGDTFALAVELFAAGFVADFVELAPIDAVLLSAAELTFDAPVTAASFASGLSVSTFAATVSAVAVVGAREFAAGTGAGVCFAVIAEFDFT